MAITAIGTENLPEDLEISLKRQSISIGDLLASF
jgi:hypothetical protein